MSADGWKKIAEAMRRRQEEEAYRVRAEMEKFEIADEQLKEHGRAVKRGSDPEFPRRKRTRRY